MDSEVTPVNEPLSTSVYNSHFHLGYSEAMSDHNLYYIPRLAVRTRPKYYCTTDKAFKFGYNLAILKAMEVFVLALGGEEAEWMDKLWVDET